MLDSQESRARVYRSLGSQQLLARFAAAIASHALPAVVAFSAPLHSLPLHYTSALPCSNFYFLCVAILQTVPEVSITNGVPATFLPLSIVLGFDGIVTAREDYKRHQDDARANSSESEWGQLQHCCELHRWGCSTAASCRLWCCSCCSPTCAASLPCFRLPCSAGHA